MGISFAPISAPQLAPQKRSDLDGLAELLLAITQSRTQREQFREQMALQRQQEERAAAESGERRTLSREEAARQKEAADRQKRQDEADDLIGNALPGVLTVKGGKPEQADFEESVAQVMAALNLMEGHCQMLINLLSERDTQQPARIDGVFLATHLHEVSVQLRRSFTGGLADADVAAVLAQNEAIMRGNFGVL